MKGGPELYTPWREPAAVVARHVGRERELEALRSAIRAFLAGGRPVHLYLFGPRGVGKSHLLTMITAELEEEARKAGAVMITMPEDIPVLRSARATMRRIDRPGGVSRWARRMDDGTSEEQARRIVLFEGLDRQLRGLDVNGRRELRRLLEDRGDYLIATGASLDSAFTGKEEAFYGAFDPWPLEVLGDETARQLVTRFVGESCDPEDADWNARLQILVTLAGGNPRALLAMGEACASEPEGWVSDHLYSVLRQLTAHYQMRFRDLSPQAQQIVEVMAEAPGELTPTEVGVALGLTTTQVSVQAGRMVQDGVLARRSEGRASWYMISEPMFRYWLECRTRPWEQTRVARRTREIQQRLMSVGMGSEFRPSPATVLRERPPNSSMLNQPTEPRTSASDLDAGARDSARGRRLHRELECLQTAIAWDPVDR